jgi:hypothetical protein
MTLSIVALIAALAAAPQTGTNPRAPQTDRTVDVARGARVVVTNFAGDVTVRAWDREAVRVRARHSTRVRVDVRATASAVEVSAHAERGPAGSVDYEIDAPAWMPVRIEGTYAFGTVEGMQSEISLETVRGDLVVKGGNGVTAKSVEGKVHVERATGRIHVSSVNEGIALASSSGEVVAETVNGPITMSAMSASSVDAGTINGDILYDGAAAAAGRYRLTSHNGGIVVAVPGNTNATFAVRTYSGSFGSALPVKGEGDVRRGRRVVYTLGKGGAEFEIETFAGSVRLQQAGGTAASQKGAEQ